MFDTLVYAMSTRGILPLDQFNELLRRVYLPPGTSDVDQIDVDVKRQAYRVLDSLGYCEFDYTKRKVYMCRPGLVLLPSFSLPKAVLTGARTPNLMSKLKSVVRKLNSRARIENILYSREGSSAPTVLQIQTADVDTIKEIAEKTGIAYDTSTPAAWKLVNISTGLNEIEDSLKFIQRSEPGWSKRVFNPKRIMFSKFAHSEHPKLLIEYRHPVTRQLYHWIWKNGNSADIGRNWGRYMVLAEKSILLFDEKRFKFAVPVTVPLPCLLARSAALCTGIPPVTLISLEQDTGSVPAGLPLQVYSGVTPEIAELIAVKLKQKLIYTSLAEGWKGTKHA